MISHEWLAQFFLQASRRSFAYALLGGDAAEAPALAAPAQAALALLRSASHLTLRAPSVWRAVAELAGSGVLLQATQLPAARCRKGCPRRCRRERRVGARRLRAPSAGGTFVPGSGGARVPAVPLPCVGRAAAGRAPVAVTRGAGGWGRGRRGVSGTGAPRWVGRCSAAGRIWRARAALRAVCLGHSAVQRRRRCSSSSVKPFICSARPPGIASGGRTGAVPRAAAARARALSKPGPHVCRWQRQEQ